MILHLTEDNLFIDSIIKALESINITDHIFLVNIPTIDYKLKYIKSDNVICATYGSEEYMELLNRYSNADAVIFHNLLKRYKWEILKNMPGKTTSVWIAWGGDLYGSAKIANSFYKPLTKKHVHRIQKANSTFNGPFKDILFEIGSFVPLTWRVKLGINDNIQNYFKYIDYMCPVIYEDYKLLKKHYPETHFKYLPFNYNVNANIYNDLNMPLNRGVNILVGNSASPVNNHLDTFEILKSIPLQEGQKIIVPLSYGGDAKYIETIVKKGKQYFGDHFLPIMDFMPKDEYEVLLQSVGFGFFNSIRQHAMGNINILLFMGAKVFLDNRNPAYQYYKRWKVTLSCLNKPIPELHKDLLTPIKNVEIRLNRSVLHNRYGQEFSNDKLTNFINVLQNISTF